MKRVLLTLALTATTALVIAAEEPDGLKLPAGFHATVVADGVGAARHMAIRDNGDIYLSTPIDKDGKGGGLIALRLDQNHRAKDTQPFGSVSGGTAIRFHDGALYVASPSAIYKFTMKGDALVPTGEPEVIIDGMPAAHPGFNRTNRAIAFDDRGNLFVALDASGNLCAAPNPPAGTKPVGLKPCPDLSTRAGIWRFSASKTGQRFPQDGEHWSSGIRDITALDWSPADGNVYALVHGRDGTHNTWPDLVSTEDDDHIADEMHRATKGADFGWPYSYYDGVKNVRLVSPEYGGDGKTSPPAGTYATPVLTFHSRRAAPVDVLFYNGKRFPASYQHGAFIVLHGTANRNGYNIVFVPFDKKGRSGEPSVFADGFAAFDQAAQPGGAVRAKYRPIGIASAPDGSLYVVDSNVGRLWRIDYDTARARTAN